MDSPNLNMYLCFNTEVGRRYIDEKFTLLALTFGNPEPLEKLNYRQFNTAFEQAFGVSLMTEGWGMLSDAAQSWIAAYCAWYKENSGEAKATQL